MPTSRVRSLLPYVVTGVLSFIAFFFAFDLWKANLAVPFQYANYGDVINTKMDEMLNGGWLFWDPRLAAPFGQATQGLPELYTLNWAIRWVLVELTRSAFIAENLFNILSPILNALAFLYAARRLGLAFQAAIPCAVLYGNLYLVFWRIIAGHEFIAAYWVVPLICLALVQIADGTPLQRTRDGAVFVATAILAGLESHYEAFFACYLAVVAILIGCFRTRSFRPLQTGRAFILITAASFALNDAPAILWTLTRHHASSYARVPIEAYLYSLSLSQMILPIPSHRIPLLATVRLRFDNIFPSLTTENASATLGLIATFGLAILVITLVVRGARNVPHALEDGALFTLAAFALATTGGLGAIFNRFVMPEIRAYNRISPFIAFFCLLAAAYVLDHIWRNMKAGKRSSAYATLAVVVMAVGVFDQSPAAWAPFEQSKARVAIDRAWSGRIVASLPAHAAVLELPYVSYPELPIVQSLYAQQEQIPSLYSSELRWSVGAVEGTRDAGFEKWLASLPPKALLSVTLLTGFDGILVYRQGLADRGKGIESELQSLSNAKPIVNDDATEALYPLGDLQQVARTADPEAGTAAGLADAVTLFEAGSPPESNPHVFRIESAIAKPS